MVWYISEQEVQEEEDKTNFGMISRKQTSKKESPTSISSNLMQMKGNVEPNP
jgi:hypothetical protein